MNNEKYLAQEEVKSFIEWVNLKSVENSFSHSYFQNKSREYWSCNSVFNAFENYKWSFTSFDPLTKEIISGDNFDDSNIYLAKISDGLKKAIKDNDEIATVLFSKAILKWGGVLAGNNQRLDKISANASVINLIVDAQKRLNPINYSLDDNVKGIPMNSGFSKIYSMIINDFVIYDGRVGAALGLLVRKFHEETKRPVIKDTLSFYYGVKKGEVGESSRNPSTEQYKFRKLNGYSQTYIRNNMKANWLIKAIVDHKANPFNELPVALRMRAKESALFMMGYAVR